MKLLKPSPHRARNDFDLSHRHVFDANFGELLPATCIETVPGDNITLHASDLLRAIPFVSSPFLRAKQHLDVWFVPYHDLWHQFDAFITQKTEPVSSAFKSHDYLPHFSQYQLYNSINAYDSTYPDICGRNLSDRSYYLLQLLGYGDVANTHGTSSKSFEVNPFRLAAYNYIWYNEYRQQYYDDGTRVLPNNTSAAVLFNFDDLACDSAANANIYDGTSASQRRIAAMAQMRYRTWKKDLFTGVLPSSQFGNVSAISIGDMTGLTGTFTGVQSSINVTGSNTSSVTIPDGSFSSGKVWVDDPDSGSSGVNQSHAIGFYANDYINSELRGKLQSLIGGNTEDLRLYGSVENGIISANGIPISASGTYTPNGSVSLSGSSAGLGFDVLALRKAEAVQIWRENALRAGNHIKDNMIAHYGVASDFNDHRPTYLGSVSSPLNIGDIAVTANGTFSGNTNPNTNVGDIAGKGLSSLNEKVFKFHAKDFGVIIVMFSMLPEAEYDAVGIERNNQLLESEDFFVPEYENLGLEAVGLINVAMPYQGLPENNGTLGYAPRYYGYKTKLDKCFGQFAKNGIFRTWTSQRTDVTTYYNDVQTPPSVPLQFLYVNPANFDANFSAAISVSPQFLCDIYFEVDAVRPMSVIGLPFSS